MLRRLALVAVLAAAAIPAAAFDLDLNLAVGLDLGGSFDLGAVDLDSGSGYTLGLEVVLDIPLIELGAGLEYASGRSPENADGDLSWYSVYAVGRLHVLGPVYLAARYGWTDASLDRVLEGDAGSGSTWGVGAGVGLLGTIQVEALLNTVSVDVGDANLGYETWSLRLLYTF